MSFGTLLHSSRGHHLPSSPLRPLSPPYNTNHIINNNNDEDDEMSQNNLPPPPTSSPSPPLTSPTPFLTPLHVPSSSNRQFRTPITALSFASSSKSRSMPTTTSFGPTSTPTLKTPFQMKSSSPTSSIAPETSLRNQMWKTRVERRVTNGTVTNGTNQGGQDGSLFDSAVGNRQSRRQAGFKLPPSEHARNRVRDRGQGRHTMLSNTPGNGTRLFNIASTTRPHNRVHHPSHTSNHNHNNPSHPPECLSDPDGSDPESTLENEIIFSRIVSKQNKQLRRQAEIEYERQVGGWSDPGVMEGLIADAERDGGGGNDGVDGVDGVDGMDDEDQGQRGLRKGKGEKMRTEDRPMERQSNQTTTNHDLEDWELEIERMQREEEEEQERALNALRSHDGGKGNEPHVDDLYEEHVWDIDEDMDMD